jgi:hypothetical protein
LPLTPSRLRPDRAATGELFLDCRGLRERKESR